MKTSQTVEIDISISEDKVEKSQKKVKDFGDEIETTTEKLDSFTQELQRNAEKMAELIKVYEKYQQVISSSKNAQFLAGMTKYSGKIAALNEQLAILSQKACEVTQEFIQLACVLSDMLALLPNVSQLLFNVYHYFFLLRVELIFMLEVVTRLIEKLKVFNRLNLPTEKIIAGIRRIFAELQQSPAKNSVKKENNASTISSINQVQKSFRDFIRKIEKKFNKLNRVAPVSFDSLINKIKTIPSHFSKLEASPADFTGILANFKNISNKLTNIYTTLQTIPNKIKSLPSALVSNKKSKNSDSILRQADHQVRDIYKNTKETLKNIYSPIKNFNAADFKAAMTKPVTSDSNSFDLTKFKGLEKAFLQIPSFTTLMNGFFSTLRKDLSTPPKVNRHGQPMGVIETLKSTVPKVIDSVSGKIFIVSQALSNVAMLAGKVMGNIQSFSQKVMSYFSHAAQANEGTIASSQGVYWDEFAKSANELLQMDFSTLRNNLTAHVIDTFFVLGETSSYVQAMFTSLLMFDFSGFTNNFDSWIKYLITEQRYISDRLENIANTYHINFYTKEGRDELRKLRHELDALTISSSHTALDITWAAEVLAGKGVSKSTLVPVLRSIQDNSVAAKSSLRTFTKDILLFKNEIDQLSNNTTLPMQAITDAFTQGAKQSKAGITQLTKNIQAIQDQAKNTEASFKDISILGGVFTKLGADSDKAGSLLTDFYKRLEAKPDDLMGFFKQLNIEIKDSSGNAKEASAVFVDAIHAMSKKGFDSQQLNKGFQVLSGNNSISVGDLDTKWVSEYIQTIEGQLDSISFKKVADRITVASVKAGTSIGDLKKTIESFSAKAKDMKVGAEEISIWGGAFSKLGVNGKEAESAFESLYNRFSSPPEDLKEFLQELGVDTNKATDSLSLLAEATAKMGEQNYSPEKFTEGMKKLAGNTSISIDQSQAQWLKGYIADVKNASNVVKSLADENKKHFIVSMQIINNRVGGIFSKTAHMYSRAVEFTQGLLSQRFFANNFEAGFMDRIGSLLPQFDRVSAAFHEAIAPLATLFAPIISVFTSVYEFFVNFDFKAEETHIVMAKIAAAFYNIGTAVGGVVLSFINSFANFAVKALSFLTPVISILASITGFVKNVILSIIYFTQLFATSIKNLSLTGFIQGLAELGDQYGRIAQVVGFAIVTMWSFFALSKLYPAMVMAVNTLTLAYTALSTTLIGLPAVLGRAGAATLLFARNTKLAVSALTGWKKMAVLLIAFYAAWQVGSFLVDWLEGHRAVLRVIVATISIMGTLYALVKAYSLFSIAALGMGLGAGIAIIVALGAAVFAVGMVLKEVTNDFNDFGYVFTLIKSQVDLVTNSFFSFFTQLSHFSQAIVVAVAAMVTFKIATAAMAIVATSGVKGLALSVFSLQGALASLALGVAAFIAVAGVIVILHQKWSKLTQEQQEGMKLLAIAVGTLTTAFIGLYALNNIQKLSGTFFGKFGAYALAVIGVTAAIAGLLYILYQLYTDFDATMAMVQDFAELLNSYFTSLSYSQQVLLTVISLVTALGIAWKIMAFAKAAGAAGFLKSVFTLRGGLLGITLAIAAVVAAFGLWNVLSVEVKALIIVIVTLVSVIKLLNLVVLANPIVLIIAGVIAGFIALGAIITFLVGKDMPEIAKTAFKNMTGDMWKYVKSTLAAFRNIWETAKGVFTFFSSKENLPKPLPVEPPPDVEQADVTNKTTETLDTINDKTNAIKENSQGFMDNLVSGYEKFAGIGKQTANTLDILNGKTTLLFNDLPESFRELNREMAENNKQLQKKNEELIFNLLTMGSSDEVRESVKRQEKAKVLKNAEGVNQKDRDNHDALVEQESALLKLNTALQYSKALQEKLMTVSGEQDKERFKRANEIIKKVLTSNSFDEALVKEIGAQGNDKKSVYEALLKWLDEMNIDYAEALKKHGISLPNKNDLEKNKPKCPSCASSSPSTPKSTPGKDAIEALEKQIKLTGVLAHQKDLYDLKQKKVSIKIRSQVKILQQNLDLAKNNVNIKKMQEENDLLKISINMNALQVSQIKATQKLSQNALANLDQQSAQYKDLQIQITKVNQLLQDKKKLEEQKANADYIKKQQEDLDKKKALAGLTGDARKLEAEKLKLKHKYNGKETDEYKKQVAALEEIEKQKRKIAAIDKHAKTMQAKNDALQLARMSKPDQEREKIRRKLGSGATAEQINEIVAINEQITKQKEFNKTWDDLSSKAEDYFSKVVDGSMSVKDAFKNMAKDIAKVFQKDAFDKAKEFLIGDGKNGLKAALGNLLGVEDASISVASIDKKDLDQKDLAHDKQMDVSLASENENLKVSLGAGFTEIAEQLKIHNTTPALKKPIDDLTYAINNKEFYVKVSSDPKVKEENLPKSNPKDYGDRTLQSGDPNYLTPEEIMQRFGRNQNQNTQANAAEQAQQVAQQVRQGIPKINIPKPSTDKQSSGGLGDLFSGFGDAASKFFSKGKAATAGAAKTVAKGAKAVTDGAASTAGSFDPLGGFNAAGMIGMGASLLAGDVSGAVGSGIGMAITPLMGPLAPLAPMVGQLISSGLGIGAKWEVESKGTRAKIQELSLDVENYTNFTKKSMFKTKRKTEIEKLGGRKAAEYDRQMKEAIDGMKTVSGMLSNNLLAHVNGFNFTVDIVNDNTLSFDEQLRLGQAELMKYSLTNMDIVGVDQNLEGSLGRKTDNLFSLFNSGHFDNASQKFFWGGEGSTAAREGFIREEINKKVTNFMVADEFQGLDTEEQLAQLSQKLFDEYLAIGAGLPMTTFQNLAEALLSQMGNSIDFLYENRDVGDINLDKDVLFIKNLREMSQYLDGDTYLTDPAKFTKSIQAFIDLREKFFTLGLDPLAINMHMVNLQGNVEDFNKKMDTFAEAFAGKSYKQTASFMKAGEAANHMFETIEISATDFVTGMGKLDVDDIEHKRKKISSAELKQDVGAINGIDEGIENMAFNLFDDVETQINNHLELLEIDLSNEGLKAFNESITEQLQHTVSFASFAEKLKGKPKELEQFNNEFNQILLQLQGLGIDTNAVDIQSLSNIKETLTGLGIEISDALVGQLQLIANRASRQTADIDTDRMGVIYEENQAQEFIAETDQVAQAFEREGITVEDLYISDITQLSEQLKMHFTELGVEVSAHTFEAIRESLAASWKSGKPMNDVFNFREFEMSFVHLRDAFKGTPEAMKKWQTDMVKVAKGFEGAGIDLNDLKGIKIKDMSNVRKEISTQLKGMGTEISEEFLDQLSSTLIKSWKAYIPSGKDFERTIPKTRDEFYKLVQSLDLTTVRGKELFTALMDNLSAMDEYYKSVEFYDENFRMIAKSTEGYIQNLEMQALGAFSSLSTTNISDEAKAIFDAFEGRLPATRREFVKLVDALDLTQEADRKLYTELMGITPALEEFYQSSKNVANQAVTDARKLRSSLSADSVNLFDIVMNAANSTEAGQKFAEQWEMKFYESFMGSFIQSIQASIFEGVVNPLIDSTLNMTSNIASGGAVAGQMLQAGGRLTAEELASVVSDAKDKLAIMTQVLNALEESGAMTEFKGAMGQIGTNTFNGVVGSGAGRRFKDYTNPPKTDEETGGGASTQESEKFDWKAFINSLKQYTVGYNEQLAKIERLDDKYAEIDLKQLALTSDASEIANKLLTIPEAEWESVIAATKITDELADANKQASDNTQQVTDDILAYVEAVKALDDVIWDMRDNLREEAGIDNSDHLQTKLDKKFKEAELDFDVDELLNTHSSEDIARFFYDKDKKEWVDFAEAHGVGLDFLTEYIPLVLETNQAREEELQKVREFRDSLRELSGSPISEDRSTLNNLLDDKHRNFSQEDINKLLYQDEFNGFIEGVNQLDDDSLKEFLRNIGLTDEEFLQGAEAIKTMRDEMEELRNFFDSFSSGLSDDYRNVLDFNEKTGFGLSLDTDLQKVVGDALKVPTDQLDAWKNEFSLDDETIKDVINSLDALQESFSAFRDKMKEIAQGEDYDQDKQLVADYNKKYGLNYNKHDAKALATWFAQDDLSNDDMMRTAQAMGMEEITDPAEFLEKAEAYIAALDAIAKAEEDLIKTRIDDYFSAYDTLKGALEGLADGVADSIKSFDSEAQAMDRMQQRITEINTKWNGVDIAGSDLLGNIDKANHQEGMVETAQQAIEDFQELQKLTVEHTNARISDLEKERDLQEKIHDRVIEHWSQVMDIFKSGMEHYEGLVEDTDTVLKELGQEQQRHTNTKTVENLNEQLVFSGQAGANTDRLATHLNHSKNLNSATEAAEQQRIAWQGVFEYIEKDKFEALVPVGARFDELNKYLDDESFVLVNQMRVYNTKVSAIHAEQAALEKKISQQERATFEDKKKQLALDKQLSELTDTAKEEVEKRLKTSTETKEATTRLRDARITAINEAIEAQKAALDKQRELAKATKAAQTSNYEAIYNQRKILRKDKTVPLDMVTPAKRKLDKFLKTFDIKSLPVNQDSIEKLNTYRELVINVANEKVEQEKALFEIQKAYYDTLIDRAKKLREWVSGNELADDSIKTADERIIIARDNFTNDLAVAEQWQTQVKPDGSIVEEPPEVKEAYDRIISNADAYKKELASYYAIGSDEYAEKWQYLQDVMSALADKTDTNAAALPLDETKTAENIASIRAINEQTLSTLLNIDTALNTIAADPQATEVNDAEYETLVKHIDESGEKAIDDVNEWYKTNLSNIQGSFEQSIVEYRAFQDQYLALAEVPFNDDPFAAEIKALEMQAIAELNRIGNLTLIAAQSLDFALKEYVTLLSTQLTGSMRTDVGIRLDKTLKNDVVGGLKALGFDFNTAVNTLGVNFQAASANIAKSVQHSLQPIITENNNSKAKIAQLEQKLAQPALAPAPQAAVSGIEEQKYHTSFKPDVEHYRNTNKTELRYKQVAVPKGYIVSNSVGEPIDGIKPIEQYNHGYDKETLKTAYDDILSQSNIEKEQVELIYDAATSHGVGSAQIAETIGMPQEKVLALAEKYDLPRFAEGAVVNKATVGVFGEAGTEAIIPLHKFNDFAARQQELESLRSTYSQYSQNLNPSANSIININGNPADSTAYSLEMFQQWIEAQLFPLLAQNVMTLGQHVSELFNQQTGELIVAAGADLQQLLFKFDEKLSQVFTETNHDRALWFTELYKWLLAQRNVNAGKLDAVISTLQGVSASIGASLGALYQQVQQVQAKAESAIQQAQQAASQAAAQSSMLQSMANPTVGGIGVIQGQFAVGSAGIPHDMVAMVHKGEKILPANLSSELEKYGIPSYVQTIDSQSTDPINPVEGETKQSSTTPVVVQTEDKSSEEIKSLREEVGELRDLLAEGNELTRQRLHQAADLSEQERDENRSALQENERDRQQLIDAEDSDD